MLRPMDPRTHPYRHDIAADWLEGQVDSERYVPGTVMQVCEPFADVRHAPAPDARLDTQAVHGELVTVYEVTPEGWAWGQLEADGYVGFMPSGALSDDHEPPSHHDAHQHERDIARLGRCGH